MALNLVSRALVGNNPAGPGVDREWHGELRRVRTAAGHAGRSNREARGEEAARKGTMVSFGGLKPTSSGARMRITSGKIITTDGPFCRVEGSDRRFSIFNVASKEEALEEARKFMELHRVHWPNGKARSRSGRCTRRTTMCGRRIGKRYRPTLGGDRKQFVYYPNVADVGPCAALDDDVVGKLDRMKTQPAMFSGVGEGVCVGRDSAEPVSSTYQSPFPFRGGKIKQVTADVTGDAYRDLEREIMTAFARD